MGRYQRHKLESVTEQKYPHGGVDHQGTNAELSLEDMTFKIENGLVSLGLTPNEARLYTFLARAGAKKASEAAKTLSLPRTQTYSMLSSLQRKGLVSSTMHYPVRFTAVSLDKAVDALIDTEKQRLSSFERQKGGMIDLWSSIISKVVTYGEIGEEKFQILEGNVIYKKIKDLVSAAKEEVIIIGNQRQLVRLYHHGVTDHFAPLTAAGVDVKILGSELPTEVLSEVESCTLKVLQESDNMHYIVVDKELMVFFVKDSSETSKPSAFWTDCKSLVHCISCLFEQLWKGYE